MENAPATSSQTAKHHPQQFRVIEGTLYARQAVPSSHDIRIHRLGHGHTEATIQPHFTWYEVGNLSPQAVIDAAMSAGNVFVDGQWIPRQDNMAEKERRALRDRERASKRAVTKVRRLCKDRGLTSMITLTYKENVLDRERMARDFDVFMKRLRRALPDIQYVCVFERQKRGAWHAHIAVPRVLSHYMHKGTFVKSYTLIRAIWSAVVGGDDMGDADISKKGKRSRSPIKLAAYMSKYIGKGFGENEGDSYRASGRALPSPEVIRVHGPFTDASVRLLEIISDQIAAGAEYHHHFLDGGGVFVTLYLKPPK